SSGITGRVEEIESRNRDDGAAVDGAFNAAAILIHAERNVMRKWSGFEISIEIGESVFGFRQPARTMIGELGVVAVRLRAVVQNEQSRPAPLDVFVARPER